MKELKFGLQKHISPYLDRGALNHSLPVMRHPVNLAVFQRDFYSCCYCGFTSEKYQTCVGAASEAPDALWTACIFCEQVLHLNVIPEQKSGCLIWLPEISQVELNRAMPEIYALRITTLPEAKKAKAVLDRIQNRRKEAQKNFGSDDPLELVRRLQSSNYDEKEINQLTEEGLRIMPLDRKIVQEGVLQFNKFPQILAYWRSKNGPCSRAKIEASEFVNKLDHSLASASS